VLPCLVIEDDASVPVSFRGLVMERFVLLRDPFSRRSPALPGHFRENGESAVNHEKACG